jgi:hypothetical protein
MSLDEKERAIAQAGAAQGKSKAEVLSAISRYRTEKESKPQDGGKGFLQKAEDVVTKFFPGQKVGEAIGTLGGFGLTALKEKLGLAPKGSTQAFDTSAPSPKEVVGDVAQGALTVVGFKGAGIGKTAIGTIGKSAALGGGFGVAGGMADDQSVKEIAQRGVSGAVTGGVVGGVAQGVGKIAESTLKNLPNRLVQSAIGQPKREILAGKDLTKFVTQNKKIGTAQGLLDESRSAMSSLNKQIQTELQKSNKFIKPQAILKSLEKNEIIQNSLMSSDDVLNTVAKIAPQSKKLLSQDKLSIQDLNKLRQQIDKSLGSKVFDAPEVAFQKEVAKEFVNKLRAVVQKSAPKTKDLFKTYSQEIRLSDALANKLQRGNKNQIISFGDLIGGGFGSAFGGPVGGVAGVAARRAIQSTPFLTASAVVADRLSQNLTPVLQKLSPAIQTEIMDAIEGALSSPTNQ